MKKIFALVCLALALCCCTKNNGKGSDPTPTDDWKNSYNGILVQKLSDAYGEWEGSGLLPTSVNWEGLKIGQAECLRAGTAVLIKIMDDGNNWWKEDVSYPKANVSMAYDSEPFLPKTIDWSDFEGVLRAQYKVLMENGTMPMRVTPEGYDKPLTTLAQLTMICRACAEFCKNGILPKQIDTWDATYLISTNNCPIDDPVVAAALAAAFEKASITDYSTQREKAVAIFNYARDEWEWENYNNTKRGAVGTIQAKLGNCCDLSHALVAMYRLSGIPARYFHAQCYYSSGTIGHVISQPFVDGKWEFADASNNGNEFGKVSFNGYESLHYYESLEF